METFLTIWLIFGGIGALITILSSFWFSLVGIFSSREPAAKNSHNDIAFLVVFAIGVLISAIGFLFGPIFLVLVVYSLVKEYRTGKLNKTPLCEIFPLWWSK